MHCDASRLVITLQGQCVTFTWASLRYSSSLVLRFCCASTAHHLLTDFLILCTPLISWVIFPLDSVPSSVYTIWMCGSNLQCALTEAKLHVLLLHYSRSVVGQATLSTGKSEKRHRCEMLNRWRHCKYSRCRLWFSSRPQSCTQRTESSVSLVSFCALSLCLSICHNLINVCVCAVFSLLSVSSLCSGGP